MFRIGDYFYLGRWNARCDLSFHSVRVFRVHRAKASVSIYPDKNFAMRGRLGHGMPCPNVDLLIHLPAQSGIQQRSDFLHPQPAALILGRSYPKIRIKKKHTERRFESMASPSQGDLANLWAAGGQQIRSPGENADAGSDTDCPECGWQLTGKFSACPRCGADLRCVNCAYCGGKVLARHGLCPHGTAPLDKAAP